MTADEAIALVRTQLGQREVTADFRAERAEGTPAAWYVSLDAKEQPLVGGTAFVVIPDGEQVFEVPASKPPALNLREVRALLAG